MAEYVIRGGRKIRGEMEAHGAKNAALPVLAASIITGGENLIRNCPDISDCGAMREILTTLGCRVRDTSDGLLIDTAHLSQWTIPENLMKRMRSSVFLVGALLARKGRAVISQPGGCSIGERPIDLHIKALCRMGAEVCCRGDSLVFTADRLRGADITLDYPSVGATENIMLAAAGAEGETVIRNCAREPEIADLQNYLISCGVRVKGAGSRKIVIRPVEAIHGGTHTVMGDRIEAGTYLMAAAATGGELSVTGVEASALKAVTEVLEKAGCRVTAEKNRLTLKGPAKLKNAGRVATAPFPGFPTDLQPQLTAIMTKASGTTKVKETVFENRMGYASQLIKMGANIEISHRIAIIKGKDFLSGKTVEAADLRGGAALVIAGLTARGETRVKNAEFIERGYSDLCGGLRKLGAGIHRCI